MDIKHRLAYASIKHKGRSEAILLNQGLPLLALVGEVTRAMMKLESRYTEIDVHYQFTPISEHMTESEKSYQVVLAGLDMSAVEQAPDDEDDPWLNHPRNPNGPAYDPLLDEYFKCMIPSHRASKTPEDLAMLRKHMETKWRGTEWWDGSHTF